MDQRLETDPPLDEGRTERGAVGRDVNVKYGRKYVTGSGEYVDDIQPAGTAHVSFVRSRYGHARLEGVDASDAESIDGVLAVYTATDLAADEDVATVIQGDGTNPDILEQALAFVEAADDGDDH